MSRIARDNASDLATLSGVNPYESPRLLHEYLLFHYGTAEDTLPWPAGDSAVAAPRDAVDFPARVVQLGLDPAALPPGGGRALDLGCAVGRASFELARHCEEVVGIDYSAAFVAAADLLRTAGEHPCERAEEGEVSTPLVLHAPAGVDRERIRCAGGDAGELRPGLGAFDVILLANLLDRLPDPARCLALLPALAAPGAQLLITSPYTWGSDWTPRERWLGGWVDAASGRAIRTRATLEEMLAPDFEPRGARDVPFLLREHARKYQWSVAELTVWRRRG